LTELLYAHSGYAIAGILLGSAVGATEAGYRLGLRAQARSSAAARKHVDNVQASMLGLLALLLGFTFSLSLGRYESRSVAVIDETNAIGTAWLRAQALPDSVREPTREALRAYVDLRVREAAVALDHRAERDALLAAAGAAQLDLWNLAHRAMAEDSHSVMTGLYVQALNELIDAYGRRIATLDRHVPEAVSLVLYMTMIFVAGVVGYAAGLGDHRPFNISYLMLMLIVLLVFVIVDIDRPRRGLIQVNRDSLTGLQATIESASGIDDGPGR
jgi:hypothetical protein